MKVIAVSEQAKLTHERLNAELIASARLSGTLGIFAIRIPGIVAGAGLALLLAFMSEIGVKTFLENPHLTRIMMILIIIVLITTISHGIAYLSQYFFYLSLAEEQRTFSAPYRRKCAVSEDCARWSRLLHRSNMVLTISTLITLVFCVFELYEAALYLLEHQLK